MTKHLCDIVTLYIIPDKNVIIKNIEKDAKLKYEPQRKAFHYLENLMGLLTTRAISIGITNNKERSEGWSIYNANQTKINAQTKYIEVILVKKNAIRNKYPLVALLIDKYKSIILKDPIYLFKLNGLLYVQIDKL